VLWTAAVGERGDVGDFDVVRAAARDLRSSWTSRSFDWN
jgi:hypothetical protein